jgi:hypothetical protein
MGRLATTKLLRHRDISIDAPTKARYHRALGNSVPGLKMPTPADELAHPETADAVYRSVTRRLAEARRGPNFPMISYENASYGFRRNMLGLKPIAIVLAFLVAVLTGLGWWLLAAPDLTMASLLNGIAKYPHLLLFLLIDLGVIGFWTI